MSGTGDQPEGVLDNAIFVEARVVDTSTVLPPYPIPIRSTLLPIYPTPLSPPQRMNKPLQMLIQARKQPLTALLVVRVCVDPTRSIESVYQAL